MVTAWDPAKLKKRIAANIDDNPYELEADLAKARFYFISKTKIAGLFQNSARTLIYFPDSRASQSTDYSTISPTIS